MRVEIDVPNKDDLLRPGMLAAATIHLEKASPKGMHLPISCVAKWDGHKAEVYIVKNGKAHLTVIEVGHVHEDQAVVLSGLSPGDLVVNSPGAAKLRGQVVPVRVQVGQ